MRQILLIALFLLTLSCGRDKVSEGVVLGQHGDTLKIVRHRTSRGIKEIIQYKNNKPSWSYCVTDDKDTIIWPNAFFDKTGDSLFVFIPVTDKPHADVHFDADSVDILLHRNIQFTISDLTGSAVLKVTPQILTAENESRGCILLHRADGVRGYYVFVARHH